MTGEQCRRASYVELMNVFEEGRVSATRPTGEYTGTLLMVLGRKVLRLPGWLWSGKRFLAGDRLENRMFGRWTMPGVLSVLRSRLDGEPALGIRYPGRPLLAPLQDELREVGPDRWLGVYFYLGPMVGFFHLERETATKV